MRVKEGQGRRKCNGNSDRRSQRRGSGRGREASFLRAVRAEGRYGPRQFNKLGGVWIFLISRQSWTGGRA